jgi:hypothetical protein
LIDYYLFINLFYAHVSLFRHFSEEVDGLKSLDGSLKLEGRSLQMLDPNTVAAKYGFLPRNGLAFGIKAHDRILHPSFVSILSEALRKRGAVVVDGCVTTVYTDDPANGGVVEYKDNSETGNASRYVAFDKLVMSLGAQRITDKSDKPLIDIVAARGVSGLALAYMPQGCKLPAGTVCGATNHATYLSGPVPLRNEKDGKTYDTYLLKITASACITPNVIDETCTHYDSVAATGLVSAVRQTLGCEVDVITMFGCNRQVSRYGQTHWLQLQGESGTAVDR